MISFRNRILVITALLFASTACTNEKAKSTLDSAQDMFSNRPITATPDVYMITLASPALLTVSSKTKDGWQVPADAKAKVLAEQAELEKKLAAMSADIKVIYKYWPRC